MCTVTTSPRTAGPPPRTPPPPPPPRQGGSEPPHRPPRLPARGKAEADLRHVVGLDEERVGLVGHPLPRPREVDDPVHDNEGDVDAHGSEGAGHRFREAALPALRRGERGRPRASFA